MKNPYETLEDLRDRREYLMTDPDHRNDHSHELDWLDEWEFQMTTGEK